jgi:very-short-patch-repair endonuclease
METLTLVTTKRITDDAIKTFSSVIEQMASEGCDTDQIVKAFQHHVEAKTQAFYRMPDFVKLDNVINAIIEVPADSKAERILLRILADNGIKCVFHRKIGSYVADYLVNEKVIIELGEPDHQKISQGQHDESRDRYLKRMGYEVVRIPIWALSIDSEAIVEEIKAAAFLVKPKRKKRGIG